MSKEFIYEMTDNPDSVFCGFGWKIKEKIVRCRDCMSFDHVHELGCKKFYLLVCDPDGFCSWGEQRQETVTDVLEDFLHAYDDWDENAVANRMESREKLFDRYAAKLRLACDGAWGERRES